MTNCNSFWVKGIWKKYELKSQKLGGMFKNTCFCETGQACKNTEKLIKMMTKHNLRLGLLQQARSVVIVFFQKWFGLEQNKKSGMFSTFHANYVRDPKFNWSQTQRSTFSARSYTCKSMLMFVVSFVGNLTSLESMASFMIGIQPLKVATWKSAM